jgi:hypothetical protein
MTCAQRETLLLLVRELQERGFDVRIGWIDCEAHGKHAAHFRHSHVMVSPSFPQMPNDSISLGEAPKVALGSKATRDNLPHNRGGVGGRYRSRSQNVGQILLPFRR